MENFDPELLFKPSKEKVDKRNEILNESIFSFGIEKSHSLLHVGCGSRNMSFVEYCINKNEKYIGIDANPQVISECNSKFSNAGIKFNELTIQSVLDTAEETKKTYDWIVLDGILDKNLYEDSQYEFIDTIIRNSLLMSDVGLIIYMDRNPTKNDDIYNSDFMSVFIGTTYKRWNQIRLNEHQYLFCIYKYFV